MKDMLNQKNQDSFIPYQVGDMDQRAWGTYRVINMGMEGNQQFCEKEIVVKPMKALSLQRHQHRAEIWRVKEGVLTVIIDGEMKTLFKNDEIYLNKQAVHCMANLTEMPVTVYEKQIGQCYEEDNERLADVNGRETAVFDPQDIKAVESKKLYQKIAEFLQEAENFDT